MKNIATIIAILLISSNSIYAGPWTQKKGKGYFKLSEWWIIFDEHYTDQGEIDPNSTTGIFNTFLYAEYGLTDRFTGLFNGALFTRNLIFNQVSGTTGETITPGDALNSIGDIDIGLKYSLTKPGSPIPVSASLILGLPTGNAEGGIAKNLQTGDGEFNQIFQIDAGGGFKLIDKVSTYVSGYAAFNNRSNDFSEEFRFGVETGGGFFNDRFWLIGRLTGIRSFQNSNVEGGITSTSIFANDTEFTSIGVEGNYYVSKNKKFGISAGYANAFSGNIIAADPSYNVGVFLDLSK